jgi:hypothetical protein
MRPQRLHDLYLLFGAPAAVAKILVEADELDLVPPDPDAEPEPTDRTSRQATCLATSTV